MLQDDMISRSMVSLRKAVFYFKNEGRSFKTFAYYAVSNGIKQSFDAVTKVDQATVLETDMVKKDNQKYEFAAIQSDVGEEITPPKTFVSKSKYQTTGN